MPDVSALLNDAPHESERWPEAGASRHSSTTSLRELWQVLVRRRLSVGAVVGGLLLLCILYCIVIPNQYEASAKVALRQAPASSLSMEAAAEPLAAASLLSAPLQLEPSFLGRFGLHFPGFHAEAAAAYDQDYLLR